MSDTKSNDLVIIDTLGEILDSGQTIAILDGKFFALDSSLRERITALFYSKGLIHKLIPSLVPKLIRQMDIMYDENGLDCNGFDKRGFNKDGIHIDRRSVV